MPCSSQFLVVEGQNEKTRPKIAKEQANRR
jgi:hypothetical protein